jgi:putative ABC transport system permease protein
MLTAASIVIGVAAVAAVNMTVVAVRQSFRAMQEAIAGEAALEVRAAGDGLFDQALAESLAKTPGVKAAAPVYERLTVMYFHGERISLILMAVDFTRDVAVRDYVPAEGKSPPGGDEVLLDSAFAKGLKIEVNDQVRLLTRRGLITVTVTGLLRPQRGAAVGRGSVLFMPLATAQQRFGAGDRINRIQIVLEENADRDVVAAQIARRLPEGLSLQIPAVQTQMGEETMLFLHKALKLATYFALLSAGFIIANAFMMNVTQRRRQLAILRAVGATVGQIRRLIFCEALFLATVGTAVGLVGGWGGALLLTAAMEQLFGTEILPPRLTPAATGLAIVCGVGVALLGAYLPARQATRVSPVEGMREVPHAEVEGIPRRLVLASGMAFSLSAALMGAHLAGYLPQYDAVLGVVLSLVLAVPLLTVKLRPMSRVTAVLLRPWGRVETRLARRQLLRRRLRANLTTGVLLIASSTGVGLASTVLDNIDDIQSWYHRSMAGEYFLRAMTPDLSRWELAEMPEAVESQSRSIPEIKTIYAVRFVRGEAAGQQVMIIARDYPTDDTVAVDPAIIDSALLRKKFHQGEVTIGTVLAQRTGLSAGQEIEIQTRRGPRHFTIAAVENDYMAGGLTVHIERAIAEKELEVRGADALVIRAHEGKRETVESALRQIADEHGLLLQSYAEITGMIDNMMAGVVAGLWAVMVLGLLVASLGVTNTLSMNVLEQTRELTILRVVGTTRRQTRRTIAAQAAMLGTMGLAPGVLLGAAVAWIINRSLAVAIGHPVAFHFHPLLLGGGFVVAMALVLLSAWLPARRAASLEPIEALRYE